MTYVRLHLLLYLRPTVPQGNVSVDTAEPVVSICWTWFDPSETSTHKTRHRGLIFAAWSSNTVGFGQ